MGFWSSLKKGLKKVVKVAAPLAVGYFTGGALAGGALGRFGGGRLGGLVQRGSTLFEKAKPFVRGVKRLQAARRRPAAVTVPPTPMLAGPIPIGGHGFHSTLMHSYGTQSMIPMRARRVMPDPAYYAKASFLPYLSARARFQRPRYRMVRRRRRRY